MCDICGSTTHGTPDMGDVVEVVRDGVRKEVDTRVRAKALELALDSMGNDWKSAGGTREVIKRAVVFMNFLSGDIASREQVPE